MRSKRSICRGTILIPLLVRFQQLLVARYGSLGRCIIRDLFMEKNDANNIPVRIRVLFSNKYPGTFARYESNVSGIECERNRNVAEAGLERNRGQGGRHALRAVAARHDDRAAIPRPKQQPVSECRIEEVGFATCKLYVD